MVALIVLVILGFVFLIHMAKGGYVGKGGTLLVLFAIALIISAALSIDFSIVVILMIVVVALVAVFSLFDTKQQSTTSDMDVQNKPQFAEYCQQNTAVFTLFGTEQLASGKDFRWQEALEKLALLEEGYFPYSTSIRPTESSSEKTIRLNKYELEECHYKIESTSMINNKPCSFGYLALSDVENYINFRKSIGGFYRPSIYEEVPQEIRSLFYDGKVTIGIPFGQDGYVPCQVMTIQEAREFMSRKMEERYRRYIN